jgi:hypothetical protein
MASWNPGSCAGQVNDPETAAVGVYGPCSVIIGLIRTGLYTYPWNRIVTLAVDFCLLPFNSRFEHCIRDLDSFDAPRGRYYNFVENLHSFKHISCRDCSDPC